MSIDSVSNMLFEIRLEDLSYEAEEITCYDWRDTIEVKVPSPKQFKRMARGILAKGWIGTDKFHLDRQLIGMEFDTNPKVAVVIALKDLDEWAKRYDDGVHRTIVPELADATQKVVWGSDGDVLFRMEVALTIEAVLYG